MPDDQYADLQEMLNERPDAGDIIAGSGGIRKIRWSLPGSGKRGGSRVIYYWAVSQDEIWMLYVYGKSDVVDLTKEQLKTLKQIVSRW